MCKVHFGDNNMGTSMPKDLSEFEKYLITRLDRIEDKLTDVRIKVASMAVVISLAVSVVSSLVTVAIEKKMSKSIDNVSSRM